MEHEVSFGWEKRSHDIIRLQGKKLTRCLIVSASMKVMQNKQQ
jgi:hypothetical protein